MACSADICGKVTADFLIGCNDSFFAGIEQEVYIGNRCDIDLTTLVKDSDLATGTHKVTTLEMETGAEMFKIQGIPGKSIFNSAFSKNSNDESADDWVHTLNLRAFSLTEASLSFLNNLSAGADLFAIIPSKNDRGDDAFKIFGLDAGLKCTESEYASQDNKGAVLYTLASREPDFEPKTPYVYQVTDYAATKVNIDTVLTAPAV